MMVNFVRYAMASLLFMCGTIALLCADSKEGTPLLLVSVAPHKFFVERIGGDTVDVELMVPAGASPHTFEPTPKQMLRASRADMWLQIGEGFEPRATKALKSHHSEMILVDLRKGIDLITDSNSDGGHCHCCSSASGSCEDPHFWLSLRQAKQQAKTIADALSARYPLHEKLYRSRLQLFLGELEKLDLELTSLLKPLKGKTIMVSHPAYAYFCRDYDLKQLSVEFEGKDPTPQQLTRILNKARQEKIKRIYIQVQYNSKGAKLIAKEIGAEVVTLNPYAENYLENMREIAKSFAQQ
jgi:zinc transport system substrate-binding protein